MQKKQKATDEQKIALAVKIADILREESAGDPEIMVFAIKTAAGLIWGPGYQSFIKL